MPSIICSLINLWLIALFARIILSWFPIEPGGALASIFSVLYSITEPILGPVRRVLPTVGMLDLSPIVVFIAVGIVERAVGCTGGIL